MQRLQQATCLQPVEGPRDPAANCMSSVYGTRLFHVQQKWQAAQQEVALQVYLVVLESRA